jgi:hypothetical protein
MNQDDTEECHERRQAELEFISAAYNPDTEAWHNVNATGDPMVHRLLPLHVHDRPDETDISLRLHITLTMPLDYPVGEEPLQVAAQLYEEGSASNRSAMKQRKCALNALPRLTKIAQQVADESIGVESIFTVLSRVEEWVFQGEWLDFYQDFVQDDSTQKDNGQQSPLHVRPVTAILGRRLIYSHHIISKIKRADIKALASDFQLSGYMRIGWPGLLIIEGREDDCLAFYDEIRGWNWQYLVIRGEQQDSLAVPSTSTEEQIIATNRKFDKFQEVEDMSVVAQHCRDVGLEALFRTSMKVYDNINGEDLSEQTDINSGDANSYGALVHVDHMNDPKGYRKWLRKTAKETSCRLVLKQCYEQDDYSKRPKIMVGIVGASSEEISAFLKRWRTSRVDVDSRGKACLERQMTILLEGPLSFTDDPSWEKAMAEDSVTTSDEQLGELLLQVGGSSWRGKFESTVLDYFVGTKTQTITF